MGKTVRVRGHKVPSENLAFKVHRLRLARKATKDKGNKPFRALKEVARAKQELKYLDLSRWSEKKSLLFLRKHKV